MVAAVRALLRGLLVLALLAGMASGPAGAAATDAFEGAWVAKLDLSLIHI